jgi:DNA-3-methyladenine glycosylase
MHINLLPRSFFAADPADVARRLLGQRIVRYVHGGLLAGRIVETEAYGARHDSTSHAYRGSGGRANGMFGAVGHAYVYLIYGMHHCLNVTAHSEAQGGAVLIRAMAPETGIERMTLLRKGVAPHLLASGPGRLCAALAIDRLFDGRDLLEPSGELVLAEGEPIPDEDVQAGPRVGVVGLAEHVALPWRFYVPTSPHVSPGRRR